MTYISKIAINILTFYQKFVSSSLHQLLGIQQACRFEISCSEYAKAQIKNKGVLKGSILSLVRISKCQPFYKEAKWAEY